MLEQSHKSEKSWYFITDGVSLKVTNSITIGEDADGVLALESTDEDERWLTCTVEGGELLVKHLHEQFRIELPGSWSTRKPGAVLESGMVIVMPNNEVYVGESTVRSDEEQRVYVTFNADLEAATASRQYGAQPISASRKANAQPRRNAVGTEGIGEHLLPKKKGSAGVPEEVVAPRALQAIRSGAGSQERVEEGVKRPGSKRAGAAAPIIVREQKARRRNSNRGLEILAWFMAVVAFALVVAVASNYWKYSQVRNSVVTVPPQAPPQVPPQIPPQIPPQMDARTGAGMTDPLQESVQELPIATDQEAAQSMELATTAETEPVAADPVETETETSGPAASATENMDPKSVDATDSFAGSDPTGPELTRRELAQARTLMARGFLNWPETNAMSILNQILDREPNNLVARNMLIDCAERLLADARRAYADGFADTALVQVEKLLKVYPLYLPALDQQSEWQQSAWQQPAIPQEYR